MKAKVLLFVIIITASGNTSADELLNLSIASTAMNFADWMQTSQISKDRKYYEKNPILGKHPTQTSINIYFLTASVLSVQAAYAMPRKYGVAFMRFLSLAQFTGLANNASIGLKLKF